MKQAAYLENLKKYTRGDPTTDDLIAVEQEMYSASDRAAAVVLGSFLESSLTHLLKSVLRAGGAAELFDYRGPLGDFSSKIMMAYALELIGPISRHDADLIRVLRNEFAHSRKPMKFRTPAIKAVCDALQFPNSDNVVKSMGPLTTNRLAYALRADTTDPRNRFRITCHSLSFNMLVKRSKGRGIVDPATATLP